MGHGLLTGSENEYYNGQSLTPNTGDEKYGGYQFIPLDSVIDNFMATYVGENKILPLTNRADVSFHAHRALAELSFDTLKSCKTQEITLPPHLTMPLPRDYVNYVKLTWSGAGGIEHVIYPASKTSNPKPIFQNDDGDYALTVVGTLTIGSTTVILDKEYSNILQNMSVKAPNFSLPNNTTVEYTTNSGGITTMEVSQSSTYTGTETLVINAFNDDLIEQPISSHIIENLTWNTTDSKITANSVSDISEIKVGMIITGEAFDNGDNPLRVLAINDTVITIGGIPSLASGAVVSNEATFIDGMVAGSGNYASKTKRISDTWSKYKGAVPSENNNNDDDNAYSLNIGQRYGLDPQHAQTNGSFFIDCDKGVIHFSSNLSGKDIILKYISDGLGGEHPATPSYQVGVQPTPPPPTMVIHKFAEEAIYKWIVYGCLIAMLGVPEHVIQRFKKEKFAETRKAKLRLSNIKLEEITQILRGKSKQIKH